ncbi:MAG: hypothetical protein WBG46_13055 [Nonlabens sp.]
MKSTESLIMYLLILQKACEVSAFAKARTPNNTTTYNLTLGC